MRLAIALAVLAAAAPQLHAQNFAISPCDRDGYSFHQETVCQRRTVTIPLGNGHLALTAKNGSIDVIGEDRRDVMLEAEVQTHAPSRQDAESLQHKVEIVTNGEIHAEGPDSIGFLQRSGWSVSYRLRVPRHLAAHLHTENGSVKLASLEGAITAETTNGSMTMRDLAGDVNAHTVNGSLKVSLDGDQWRGGGLYARTTNGSVSVDTPAAYSAHLIAQTVNGGMHVDFPHNTQGKRDRHVDTNIGHGGSTLHFETVNGSLHIDRI